MRVAVVHDWLTGMRGGERVLEGILELYPDAELFTLVHAQGSVTARIEDRPIHTSFLQRLPRSRTHWRYYLPFFPAAIERLDLHGYDLVLSSSHCVAKSVRPPQGALHVSYCHTPMRYVWDQYDAYFGPGRASLPVRMAMRMLAPRLRAWDRRTASRVHAFVANSRNVAGRIRRAYGRAADVVYPPVDVARFQPAALREDFHLLVSALVPYKRVDLAIAAFRDAGRELVIVGAGPEYARLRRDAPSNVRFTGSLTDAEVAALMARCRSFVQPGEEDFGIASVEAQAAGAPVVAYGAGGALETVNDLDAAGGAPPTGVLFRSLDAASLNAAIERAEKTTFDTEGLVANARRFAPERFRAGLTHAIERAWAGKQHEVPCTSPR